MIRHCFVRLILALTVLFSAGGLTAMAEDAVTVLKLHLNDGTAPTFILGDDTKITFANANMSFAASDYRFEVPLSDIVKWTYENRTSAVKDIHDSNITITRHGDVITISGLSVDAEIAVYATDGRQVHSGRSMTDVHVINAGKWIPGIYVIKAANSTFKIVKL